MNNFCYETYDWRPIQKILNSCHNLKMSVECSDLTMHRIRKALELGYLTRPQHWNAFRHRVGNHPSKGVGHIIVRELMKNPEICYTQLAKDVGCSQPNVQYHANKLGLMRRVNIRYTDIPHESVQELINAGVEDLQICKQLKITPDELFKLFSTKLVQRKVA